MQKEIKLIQKTINNANLLSAINQFAAFMAVERQYSKNTISSYLLDIKNLLTFLKKKDITLDDISQLEAPDIRKWIARCYKSGSSNRSINRALSALKIFADFLTEQKLINGHHFDKIKKSKTPKLLPRVISDEEVVKMVESIDSLPIMPWQKLRDKALFFLMFATGMRISEALSVTKENVLSTRGFFIVKGKGNKERIIPIIKPVQEMIQNYIDNCPYVIMEHEPLFVSNRGKKYLARLVQKTFAELRNINNLGAHITPHSLRHCCASSLLNKSNDLVKVKKLLGHARLSSTQIYTQISNQAIRKALDEIDYFGS